VLLLKEMFSPLEKTPKTLPVFRGFRDAFQTLSQRFRVRGEGESQIVEVLGSNATKRFSIQGCHLIFEQQEHLEEGRRARFPSQVRREALECIHYSEILANFADVRKRVECSLGFLATNPPGYIQSIDD
jgi:hypothetical protein